MPATPIAETVDEEKVYGSYREGAVNVRILVDDRKRERFKDRMIDASKDLEDIHCWA